MRTKGVFFWSLLLALTAPASAQVTAGYDSQTATWTLSNPLFSSRFQLAPDGLFRIVLLQGGTRKWISNSQPAASPIHSSVDGFPIDENTPWKLSGTHIEMADHNGRTHVIVLRNDDLKAEITLRLEAYPDQPFLHTSYAYRNLGAATRFLVQADFLNVSLDTLKRAIRTFHVSQVVQGTPLMFDTYDLTLGSQPGGLVSVYGGAHADDCTWLALRDSSNYGVVFGWEYDGQAHLSARIDETGSHVDVSGSPDNLHLPVAAGDEVSLPGAFMGFYRGDWDEAGYRTHRFVEAVLAAPAPDDRFPWVAFDSWFYGVDIDEATLRKAADIAASMGVELFIVNLGWAQQIGEWTADLSKFPSGMRAFSDYVHSLGMKIGLHVAPAEAMAQAPVLLFDPDWTASASTGYFGALSLCLGHEPVQQWTREQVRRLIEEYNIDWVTQDAGNLVKTCAKTTHTHDSSNSNWANSVNGITSLVQAMRAEFPGVPWENNSCGGDMQTFEAVRNYATFGSCDGCDPLTRRQAVYGMSYVFPARFIDRYMPEYPDIYNGRSSMFGGPWILMQKITDWTPEQIVFGSHEIQIYKALRTLIRGGKVFHLLRRPDGVRVNAIESFNYDLNSGVIFVYRPNSSAASQKIVPRGLDANGFYNVSFQESNETYVSRGADLAANGILVTLPRKYFAEIVYITGAAPPLAGVPVNHTGPPGVPPVS